MGYFFPTGQNKIGTDESTFNAILSSRSLPHLCEVFQAYHRTHGVPFEKVISNEFSGSIKTSLLAIVKCMTDCSVYFAERLYDSMAGAGTNDKALIRTIVSRSECDLGDIKIAFQKKYSKSLESFIEVCMNCFKPLNTFKHKIMIFQGDCSGDYKKMLIALVTAS
jgi:Annexin